MSFKAYFYSFSKRENSTARPTGDGTDFDIAIKFPSGVLNPVIELMTSTNMSSYNYCKIPHFDNRYYFVSDWVSDHDRWIAHLKVDVLATYKTEINSSYQYVLRSASKVNGNLIDNVYPIGTKKTVMNTDVHSPLLGVGFDYVLAVLNYDTTSNAKINGVQYWILSETQMRNFIEGMLTEDYWDLDAILVSLGISTSFMHSIVNPAQYIVEAYMLPHNTSFPTISMNQFTIGPFPMTAQGTPYKALNASVRDGNVGFASGQLFSLPQHPQTNSHGAWLNNSPYTTHILHAGPFGDIPLTFLGNSGNIQLAIDVKMDFKGNAILYVFDSTRTIKLASAFANISVQIPIIAGADNSYRGMANGTGAILSGILSGGMSIGTGGLTEIQDAVLDCVPTCSISGNNIGTLVLNQPWYVESNFVDVAGGVVAGADSGLANNKLGQPLCETYQLSSLSGYCQCSDVDISLAAYDSEISQVRSLMQTGFFLED